MVHHGHQHVLVVGDAEQPRPQRHLSGQIERATRRSAHGLRQPVCRPTGGIHNLPAEVGPLNRHHPLLRDPLGRREQRAQTLLAAHHIGQRRPQRAGIQAPTQPQRHRHVVNRGRPLQLLDKPQPGLGKRQRHHRGPLHRHHRGSPPARVSTDTGRQLGHRGRLEHRAHPNAGIQAGVDRRDQPHRRQRIPTQIEKRVVHPDPVQAQHLGVDAGQDLLDRVGRGPIPTTSAVYSGAGRARVSSLPLGVSGSASITTTAAGIM